MTQARDKLARERVKSERGAIDAHHSVGREVRAAIKRIGGRLPEDIPADEHIAIVEKRIKAAPAMLELDGPEAGGLFGSKDVKASE